MTAYKLTTYWSTGHTERRYFRTFEDMMKWKRLTEADQLYYHVESKWSDWDEIEDDGTIQYTNVA